MKEKQFLEKKRSLRWLLPHIFFMSLFLFSFSFEIYAQFGPEINISETITRPVSITTADIDGDGDLDIFAVSPDDNILGWYENLGDQNFSKIKLISTDVYGSRSISTADLDGDGLIDVLCAIHNDNKVSWYRNLGEGIFGNQQIMTSGFGPAELVYVADLDADGDMDVISAHGLHDGEYNTVVFTNNGSGLFAEGQVLSNLAVISVTVGDFDDDTDPDIILRLKIPGSWNELAICENLGENTFSEPEILFSLPISAASAPLPFIDLNGNDNMDLVFELNENYLGWYENHEELAFAFVDTIGFYHGPIKRFFVSDKDGDGDMDVLAFTRITEDSNDLSYYFVWYENNGNGFEDFQIIDLPFIGPLDNYLSDLTGDGLDDLIISRRMNSSQSLAWRPNLGGTNYGPEQAISNGISPVNVVTGDMDADGIIDILCTTHEDRLVIYKGLGDLNYAPKAFLTDEEILDNIAIGDLDNDGDLDIVGRKQYQFGTMLIWMENLGDLNFGVPIVISGIHYSGSLKVKIHDMNDDGHNDILYSHDADFYNFSWVENSGGGVFTSPPVYIIISTTDKEDFYPADFDNDGDLDILAEVDYPDDTAIVFFENNGSQYSYTILTYDATFFYPFDFNEDGYLDIVAAISSLDQIIWYENVQDGTFSDAQLILENLDLVKISYPADLDNDGDTDIISMSFSQNVSSQFELCWHEKLADQTYGEKQVIDILQSTGNILVDDLDHDGDLDILIYSDSWNQILVYQNYTYNRDVLNGRLFYDLDQNGDFDSTDVGFDLMGVYSLPQTDYSFTTPDGIFGLDLTDMPGSYTIHPETLVGWSLTTDSMSYTVIIDSSDVLTYDSLYFGFYPDSVFTILEPELTGGFPRCNSGVNYWIDVENQGTSLPSGIIKFELDESITYLSSFIEPDSIIEQNIYWHFDSLLCFSSKIFSVQVQMPNFNSMGETLNSVISVFETSPDGDVLYTASDTLDQVLVCAFDPNDKAVTPKGIDTEGFIPLDQGLEYLIRFQNTGNDTAFTVTIRDQLDPNLDFNSVNPISSSHQPMDVNVDQNGQIKFIFENIMLPDSNVDNLGSQGFVKFSVSQLPNLLPNTPIVNTAGIYFDINPPVITNTVLNTIECYTIPLPVISYNSPYLEAVVEGDFSFQWYLNGEEIDGAVEETLIPSNEGNYTVLVTDIYNCNKLSSELYFFVTTINLPIIHICQNDSASIFGNHEFESGLFIDTLSNIQGLDSLIYQELDVHQPDYLELEIQACTGDSIQIGDSYYFETAQITDSLQSIYGCDSIIVRNLVFYEKPEVILEPFDIDTICTIYPSFDLPQGLPDGGSYSGPGVINGEFYPENAGEGYHTIYYWYVNEFGCQSTDSISITIELCLSTVHQITGFKLEIYPNPTSGEIIFEKKVKKGKDLDISIFDGNSKLIISQKFLRNDDRLIIDISNEASGTYFVHIFQESEKYIFKLVKK